MTMDCTPRVVRVICWDNSESAAVATIGVQLGPVLIWAKLIKKENRMFLSMPGRKSADEKWWDHAQITDPGLKADAERQAIQAYLEEAKIVAA